MPCAFTDNYAIAPLNMLQLPDFQEKKLIWIDTAGGLDNRLRFHNDNIQLLNFGEVVNQISCHQILAVFIVGEATVTTVLLKKLKEYGVSVFFLNSNFKTYAEVISQAEGNYMLREKQYTTTPKIALRMAKLLIVNKITNQFNIVKKMRQQLSESILKETELKIKNAETNEDLLGNEGYFGKVYFQTIFTPLKWYRRSPQTKEDIPNLLLDMGYAFLFNYVDSLLHLFGFDTYKGIYHQLYFQRRSLSCDIMEPMRPIIDYALVKAHNLKRIKENDFKFEKGAYTIKPVKELRQKYTSIFLDVLTDYKESIYKYIRGYYYHVLDHKKYEFPTFNIS